MVLLKSYSYPRECIAGALGVQTVFPAAAAIRQNFGASRLRETCVIRPAPQMPVVSRVMVCQSSRRGSAITKHACSWAV